MTLLEVRTLLYKHELPFEEIIYSRKEEFLKEYFGYICSKDTENAKVAILMIRNENHNKHLLLEFNLEGQDYIFQNLYFGAFDYEMFNYNENMLPVDLINNIKTVMDGKQYIINVINLKKKKWCADARFVISEDPDEDDSLGLSKAVRKIEQPKSWLQKLLKMQYQYEIYNWNNYRGITR
ncbi:MAG: hypothetical protein IJ315_01220 [Firmicutes bacterium]|nr:hypothetical protein [Bacillota bacterium]